MATFNPDDCIFVANQASNADQFRGTFSNIPNHTVLWDIVREKLYWVNTLTNDIIYELPGSSVCDLSVGITYTANPTPETYTFTALGSLGLAPYTYVWSLFSGPFNDFAITGGGTTSVVTIDNTAFPASGKSLLSCKVTDANGCVADNYHLVNYVDPR
jgi:hypothetical protein